ncbi:MAG: TadE/TadG family type IV pilus assembly protein [Bellilinea sp.]
MASIKLNQNNRKGNRAQGIVEFALAFPVFLLIVLGIFEFGRLFIIYTSVYAAAREGARYGAAVDNLCNTEIEAEAERAGFLAGDLAISTSYEVFDKNLQLVSSNCVDAKAGDRVVVRASAPFEFITGFIPVPGGGPITLTSTAKRTIIKKVYVNWTLAPVPLSTSATGATPTVETSPAGGTPTNTATPEPGVTPTPPLPTCNGTLTVDTSGTSPYEITLVNNGGEYTLDSITVWWTKESADFVKVTMGTNIWEGNLPDSPATLTKDDLGWPVGVGTSGLYVYFDGANNAQLQGVSLVLSNASGEKCTLP